MRKMCRILELALDQSETYHNHKETMAHAGMALQLAFVVGILSISTWPPDWVYEVRLSPRFLSASAFVVIWLLIHVFVRWQLQNRRWAAFQNAALARTLRRWASETPNPDELISYKQPNHKTASAFLTFLDYLVPCQSASLHNDVDMKDWPVGLVREWQEQIRKGTGAVTAEWLLWAGSIFMLLMGLCRVLH